MWTACVDDGVILFDVKIMHGAIFAGTTGGGEAAGCWHVLLPGECLPRVLPEVESHGGYQPVILCRRLFHRTFIRVFNGSFVMMCWMIIIIVSCRMQVR